MSTPGATVGAPNTRVATWSGGTCPRCCERSLIQLVVRRPVADRGYGASNSPRRTPYPPRRIEIIVEITIQPILPILRTMFSVENLRAGRGQRGRVPCLGRGLARRSGWSRVSTCPQWQRKTVRISNESGLSDVRRDSIALQRGHDVGKALSIRNATTPLRESPVAFQALPARWVAGCSKSNPRAALSQGGVRLLAPRNPCIWSIRTVAVCRSSAFSASRTSIACWK
jgi:hypothetical protein